MTDGVTLRILVGGDHDSRKRILESRIPKSVDELCHKIKNVFGLTEPFRLQYQDKDFGNTLTCYLPEKFRMKVLLK